MKKSYIYSALLVAGMGFATSCSDDFMTLDPIGAVSESTLATEDGIDLLLAGAYTALYAQEGHNWDMGYRSLSGWVFGDVIGGDANKGSTAADQPDASNLEQWLFLDNNPYLKGKWTACYEAVKRANSVLKVAELLDPSKAVTYQAQARFIKGVQMFEAIKVFGAHVPYVTLEDFLANTDPQVSNVDENGNLIFVWDKVAEDFKFAADNLPDSWDGENKGRVTKWAAKAMLAKLYLYWSSPYNGKNGAGANHWSDAYNLLKEIIASGKTSDGKKAGLEPSYYKIFTPEGDWTSENVFDVQYQIKDNTAWQVCTINGSHAPAPQFISGAWGFYQPSYQYTNSFITDANGLPAADYLTHEVLCKMNADGTAAVSDLDTYVDPRLDMTAGRFEVPYYDWGTPHGNEVGTYIRAVDNAGLFFNKKYNPMASEAGAINDCPLASDKNLHVIRYAEVLLMAAECAIHEGDYNTALGYINQIRSRAANSAWWIKNDENPHTGIANGQVVAKNTAANYRISTYPDGYMTAANAMDILRREIRLEIGMEGNRWFDLCRWGIVKDELTKYAAFENKYIPKYNNGYNSDWICLPFPNNQVNAADGRFVQNGTWGGHD